MRLAWTAAFALWASTAPAQDIAPDAGIRATIGNQIEALRQDDLPMAFGFASPAIRDLFGTPERFGDMVRQAYPMVYRPADIRWLPLRRVGTAVVQRVMIRDAAGRLHFLDYEMIRGEAGWQINAVRLLPPQGAGA